MRSHGIGAPRNRGAGLSRPSAGPQPGRNRDSAWHLWDGFGAPVDTEAGHTLVDVRPRLAVGETVRVEYRMELPDAWRRSGAGGVMDLVVWTPPQINPMAMSVQVEAPSGWRWTDPGEPTTVESGVLVVQDVPGGATLGPFELAAAP